MMKFSFLVRASLLGISLHEIVLSVDAKGLRSSSASTTNEERRQLAIALNEVGNNGNPQDAFPLGVCEGDCDDDTECAQGLTCFQRGVAGTPGNAPVPGCVDDGSARNGIDFCIESSSITTGSIILAEVGNNGNPPEKFPLGVCEGDCDDDDECGQGLKCFQRGDGGVSGNAPVPGCVDDGSARSGVDFCYDPNPTGPGLTPVASPTGTYSGDNTLKQIGNNGNGGVFPLPLCKGDCDGDDECGDGLECFKRGSDSPIGTPENAPVPGCTGQAQDGIDYCIASSTGSSTPPPTAAPIPAPVVTPTVAPSPLPTQAPVVPPTVAPSPPPTQAPIVTPTVAPSPPPTQVPVVTPAPVPVPTAPPIPVPTVPPTEAPVPTSQEPSPVPSEEYFGDDEVQLLTWPPSESPVFVPTAEPIRISNEIVYGLQPNCNYTNSSAYNICLDLSSTSGSLTSWMTQVGNARDKIQSVITGNMDSFYTVGMPTGENFTCDGGYPAAIDDMYVCIKDIAMDGPGGAIAVAAPILVRQAGAITNPRTNTTYVTALTGTLFLDTDDLQGDSAVIYETVLHELLRVIGFGTLWEDNGLLENVNGTASYSNETSAFLEWNDMDCVGSLPVDSNKQLWDGACLGDELMSPGASGSKKLSKITIGSLQDMGYTVDYNAADEFSQDDLGDGCGDACPDFRRRQLGSEQRPTRKHRSLSKKMMASAQKFAKEALAGRQLDERAHASLPEGVRYVGGDRLDMLVKEGDDFHVVPMEWAQLKNMNV